MHGIDGVSWAPCDITSADSAADLSAAMENSTHVVHCAAVGYYTPLADRNPQLDAIILNTNVLGTRAVAEAVLNAPHLEHFVHVSSMAVHRGTRTPGNQLYASSKAAASDVVDELRVALRDMGRRTRVSKISPGYIRDTAFTRNYYSHADFEARLELDDTNSLTCDEVAWWVESVLLASPRVEVSDLLLDVAPHLEPAAERPVLG
jgi:NADP+-dependent farnesol dehydrogenase